MIIPFRYCCSVLVTTVLFISSYAGPTFESGTSIFYRFTLENGLSFNTVNHIGQDYQGFIWISTDNGLDRFDGRTFIIYHKDSKPGTLSNNRILRTFEDSDSTMWVCTGRGLDRYNRDKDNFVNVSLPGVDISNGEGIITDIAESRDGIIWILTVSDLIRFDRSKNKYQNVNIPVNYPSDQFTKVFVKSDSILWIGVTGKGLMVYNTVSGSVSYKYAHHFPSGIRQIVRSKTGDIYVAANEGILRVASKTREEKWFPYLPSNMRTRVYEAWDMMIDHHGKIWIATDNLGVQITDNNLKIQTSIMNRPGDPYSLSSNITRCIFEDRDQNIWVGTLNNGLMFMPNISTRYFTPYIPSCNSGDGQCVKTTTAVCETNSGDVWLGSDGSGLFRYDPRTGTYTNYQYTEGDSGSISANAILGILQADNNHIFLATYNGGFGRFNIRKGTFERIPLLNPVTHQEVLSVRDMIFGEGNELWLATHKDGLIKYSLREHRILKTYMHTPNSTTTLTNNYCLKVIRDHNGNLWVATYYGLSKFDPVSEHFSNYHYSENDTSSLSSDWVYSLCEDQQGRVWVGTLDGLCLYLPKTDNFRRIHLKNVKNNTINGILADSKDNLWISTNKGMVVFDPQTDKLFSFSSDEGLPGNTFLHGSYQKGLSGKLYFGATFGAISFSPEKMAVDTSTPPIVLTNLILDYKSVQVRSEQDPDSPLKKNIAVIKRLKIPYRYRQIGFEFVGINYKSPLSTHYAYMLEGFDKEWNYIGKETKINFNNLAPGRYDLRIKASNKFGYWDKKELSVILIVIPPWWRTVWFYFLLSLIIIGLVVLIIFAREGNLRRYNRILESRVKERTFEITKQNEEIKRQSNEILNQKQHIEFQRSQLEEKTTILEDQAEELKAANEQLRESNSTKDRFFPLSRTTSKIPSVRCWVL